MPSINDHLPTFTNALNDGSSIACSKNGEWYYEKWYQRLIRWLFRQNDARLALIGEVFGKCLDNLERKPVRLEASHKQDFNDYFLAGEAVRKALSQSNSVR